LNSSGFLQIIPHKNCSNSKKEMNVYSTPANEEREPTWLRDWVSCVVVKSYVQSPRRERVRKEKREMRGSVWIGRKEEAKRDRLDFGSRE
jgi:hypothetical protein